MTLELQKIISRIVDDNKLHALWLNTLSLMENSGAKKISRFQHPKLVTQQILKHSFEEARHAYFLKKQISLLNDSILPNYDDKYLLAPLQSKRYLDLLDLKISQFLKKQFLFDNVDIKYAAYLLVTYAIEVRAEYMYPIYQDILKAANSKINVKSIIMEEIGHLNEMNKEIDSFFDNKDDIKSFVIDIENNLFNNWIVSIKKCVYS